MYQMVLHADEKNRFFLPLQYSTVQYSALEYTSVPDSTVMNLHSKELEYVWKILEINRPR